jgi:hypothetical protein
LGEVGKPGVTAILRRLLKYAEKTFGILSALDEVVDARKFPQIPTSVVTRSIFTMCLAKLGSLNALEQLKGHGELRKQTRGELPSADSIGRVADKIVSDTIRDITQDFYRQLKRNKVLVPPAHGLMALIVDGHESHATYKRHCTGCMEREIGPEGSKKTQYYHRNVTAMLVGGDCCFLLDAEQQLPGEWEVACAIRLLERILKNYPRAFDVVLADALYTNSTFFNFLIEHNKDVITVLKDEQRDLLKHAEQFFDSIEPSGEYTDGGTRIKVWDGLGFVSWPQVNQKVRVVATEEASRVTRQLDGKTETIKSSWKWVTTLSPLKANAKVVVRLGHSRWNVENQGFNELANQWHSDHVYKHSATAILNFWLMTMLAANVFEVFFRRNLKQCLRRAYTKQHIAQLITAALYNQSVNYVGIPP